MTLGMLSNLRIALAILVLAVSVAKADPAEDLEQPISEYFGELTTIEAFEFLRQGPTVTGISFPKYYLWVEGVRGGRDFAGAIRVADQNGSLVVTHFMGPTEVQGYPHRVRDVFPSVLIGRIEQLAEAWHE